MMKSAQVRLHKILKNIKIQTPICPIYQNVDALPIKDPNKIKDNLLKQIVSPVLWTQTIQNMHNDGLRNLEEVGPGKVLTNLIKRINKDIIALSIEEK